MIFIFVDGNEREREGDINAGCLKYALNNHVLNYILRRQTPPFA